jgi:hypothetical protein
MSTGVTRRACVHLRRQRFTSIPSAAIRMPGALLLPHRPAPPLADRPVARTARLTTRRAEARGTGIQRSLVELELLSREDYVCRDT